MNRFYLFSQSLLIVSCLAFSFVSNAQYSDNHFEVGILGGVSNYSGDTAPNFFQPKHIHLAGGIFARYNWGDYVSFKANFFAGNLSGNDADAIKESRKIRNLSFRSRVIEGGLNAEFNLMGFQPRALEKIFSPYVFVGVSVFNFNPQAQHPDPTRDGEWINLQPLGTEGQGMAEYPNRQRYNLTQVAIPLGLGVKLALNSHWNIGLEIGARRTFTDYIDDVSLTYAVDENGDFLYDNYYSPYNAGSSNPVLQRSAAEIFADRSPELYSDGQVPTLDLDTRGRIQRGDDRDFDWFLITGVTVSYNFIDNGLVGSRKRRRPKKGCKGAGF